LTEKTDTAIVTKAQEYICDSMFSSDMSKLLSNNDNVLDDPDFCIYRNIPSEILLVVLAECRLEKTREYLYFDSTLAMELRPLYKNIEIVETQMMRYFGKIPDLTQIPNEVRTEARKYLQELQLSNPSLRVPAGNFE
jgi:hypothetical protein